MILSVSLSALGSSKVAVAGSFVKPGNSHGNDSTDDTSDISDSEADPSSTGEVGEDIIIEDDVDTNDDEGVAS